MAVRARFFDDYRLSRIEEEADRLSLHADISCSVDMATAAAICPPTSFSAQRSASADGTLESTADDDDDDNDDDDYELPLPPPHLTYDEQSMIKTPYKKSLQTTYEGERDVETSDEDVSRAALRALHFMQAKYDSLGKVKVEKPISGMMSSSPTASSTTPENRTNSTAMSQLLTLNGSARNESENCVKANGVVLAKPEICFKLQSGCSRCVSHCRDRTSLTTGDHCSHDDHSCRVRQAMHGYDHSGNCCDDSRVNNEPVRTAGHCSVNDQSGAAVGGHSQLCGNVTKQQQQQHHQQRQVAESLSHRHHHQQLHGSQSSTSSNAATGMSTQRRALPLTTAELFQVDLFYRSFKTIVHVSTCSATLYAGSACTAEHQQSGRSNQSHQHQHHHQSKTDWKPAASGIPVIVLDQRSQPSRLYIVLAERGTGFELWRQTVDKTDQYAAMSINDEPVFHVVNCPSDGDVQRSGAMCVRKMGLHFDDPLAATEFHRQLLRLADHDRIALLSSGRMGKKKLGKKGMYSRATLVTHTVARVDLGNRLRTVRPNDLK